MIRSRTVGIVAMLMACGVVRGLAAQQPHRIKVAVDFADSATGGVFQSAFSSAFRLLGDVDVVGITEDPDYILRGAVVCSDDCRNADAYAVAVQFSEPLSRATITSLASALALRRAFAGPQSSADSGSTYAFLSSFLANEEHEDQLWVAQWGRNRYEQSVVMLVRSIDAGCFDKNRAVARTNFADTVSMRQFREFLHSRQWMC